ncbi:MAG: hypothetical protein KF874_07440 [Rhizobiaceae bacterium]|nr:hypothetical protein [Rhizobiaceae bacterium]
MQDGSLWGQGFLLIALLVIIGGSLLIVSVIFNLHVADSVRNDARHREKLLEYYRNMVSQLGVILIGIGVSLFIFYFQQGYQENKRRHAELQAAVAKLSVRVSRAAAIMEGLNEFDAILDQGGPYVDPENGGNNLAVKATGDALVRQVEQIYLVERDVDQRGFEILFASRDMDNSFLASELNPVIWFNMVRDEADLAYAIEQLGQDYGDLHKAMGDTASQPLDAKKTMAVKKEVLDVFYDADLLRQRSRRLLARACWLLSKGQEFTSATPEPAIETDAASQDEWLQRARPALNNITIGQKSCFELLAAPA